MKLYKITYQGPLFGKKLHTAITYGDGVGNARYNFLDSWTKEQQGMIFIVEIVEQPKSAYLIE